MTLPAAPDNWNIERLTAERTQAVAAFGFTERQARFLVDVMIQSGVFVERQYCTFAGIVHGQKTHDFLRRLIERGYARPIRVGPLHRGRLFHVGYKPLYAAIGQADNRHRKPMPTGRMIERLGRPGGSRLRRRVLPARWSSCGWMWTDFGEAETRRCSRTKPGNRCCSLKRPGIQQFCGRTE